MRETEERVPEFWEYLSGIMKPEASLSDWRTVLGKAVDFEAFRRKYLLSTDRFTMRIFCPLKCNSGCRFCNVSEPYGDDDACEGFCPETLKSFPVENQDILINEFQGDVLLTEVARVLGFEPKLLEISGYDHTWELGRVPGFPKVPIYGTLLCMGYQMLELIAALNRKSKGPYLLLVTHDDLIDESNKSLLDDAGASYIPLNKVVRFKTDAGLELIGNFDLRELITPPPLEVELEPENIFRRCGDAWEVRFNGGEKFMLTTGHTGATYLHFMLARPNLATPVIEIMYGLTTPREIPFIESETEMIADAVALRQYRDETQLLLLELNRARESGDNITETQLQQDLNRLTLSINEILSPAGQKKKFADQSRRLIDTFRHAVVFSIEKIKQNDPRLAKHFSVTVRYGQTPGYFPDCDIDWKL